MRKGELVEYPTLNRAFHAVQDELTELGIYHHVAHVEVFWCRLPQLTAPTALGFFIQQRTPILDDLLDYREGHIYIPRLVPFQFWMQRRGSLRNVLRHEFAHALSFHRPSSIRTRRFRITFGGQHGWQEREVHQPDDPFVSKYAMSCPAEDFAETFAYTLTYRRSLHTRTFHPQLKAKFAYIASMIKRLARR